MDNDFSTQYLAYSQDFPQHLCKMCGKCCKAITTPYTHDELVELYKEGQQEAKVFIEIFKRYDSIEEAKKVVPDHVENILKEILANNPNADLSKVSFYYCPHITEDNMCSIHPTRPDCCRRAPRNGWSLFPPNCGFLGWQFQQRQKIMANVRKLKEYILELEQLPPDTIIESRNMTATEVIELINSKIKSFEKYGSLYW